MCVSVCMCARATYVGTAGEVFEFVAGRAGVMMRSSPLETAEGGILRRVAMAFQLVLCCVALCFWPRRCGSVLVRRLLCQRTDVIAHARGGTPDPFLPTQEGRKWTFATRSRASNLARA